MTDNEHGVKRYLDSLGEVPLPEGLWQRVEGARRRRMRGRLGAAVASTAVVALAVALMLPGALAPGDAGAPQLADASGAVPPQRAPLDEADRVRTVQAIDKALQVAYDRNASDDEIAPLWQARQELLLAASSTAAKKG